MYIQLNLKTPIFVSGNAVLDKVEVAFKNEDIFKSKGATMIKTGVVLEKKIPPIANDAQVSIDLKGATTAAAALLGTSIVL